MVEAAPESGRKSAPTEARKLEFLVTIEPARLGQKVAPMPNLKGPGSPPFVTLGRAQANWPAIKSTGSSRKPLQWARQRHDPHYVLDDESCGLSPRNRHRAEAIVRIVLQSDTPPATLVSVAKTSPGDSASSDGRSSVDNAASRFPQDTGRIREQQPCGWLTFCGNVPEKDDAGDQRAIVTDIPLRRKRWLNLVTRN